MLEENDRRSDNGTGERPAASFIHSGNKENALLLKSALVPK